MSLWDTMTDKDRQIAASCVFNAVAGYFSDTFMDTLSAEDPSTANSWRQEFENLLAWEMEAFQHLLDSVESYSDVNRAAAQVQQAFPGAVDVTHQQPTYSQAQAVAQSTPPQFNPGNQPVAPGNVVPFPQQPPLGGPGAAPTFTPPALGQQAQPQGSKNDALWMDLINNPQNWNDVRAQKRSDSSPDFVHRWLKTDKGKDQALWLQSRFGDAPQWVFQQLQAQGRI